MVESIMGARIRERRRYLGVTQAEMARRIGISASYLNLIERNKRRIAGHLLHRTADALEVRIEDLDGAAERRLAQSLAEIAHLPSLADQHIEADATGELIGRYPGWARALVALARSEKQAQDRARALADRITHDPFLGETAHRMLTRATSIRSAAEILTDYDDIPSDQLSRFHQIIHDESQGLTDVVEALVSYFDQAEETQTVLTPQDEVETLFEERSNHFAELEEPARDLSGLVDHRTGAPPFVTAHTIARDHMSGLIARLLDAQPQIRTKAARDRALASLLDYAAAAILMPLPEFAETAALHRYDIEALAHRFGVEVQTLCHRLTALPAHEGVPTFGFLQANAAGTIIEMRGLDGLAVPRFAGACPLWVLYRAQQTPETALRQRVLFPTGARFVFVARARAASSAEFGRPRHYLTDMLTMSEPDAALTVYAPDAGTLVEEVGPACRLCQRESCRQRVTDPLTG